MDKPYTGGCQCGAIRYEISGDPLVSADCQCRDCQQESGTGHGSHLVFAREGLITTGQPSHFEMTADSGNKKTRSFCPTCSSSVFMEFAAMPDIITIRAGSLDEPERYKPQMVTYRVRGYEWDKVDPSLTQFERMPEG